MKSITKNIAIVEINSRSSLGKTKPNIVGPRIIPASNSPPKAGCFILLKSSPKTLAPASKITIDMKICSIAILEIKTRNYFIDFVYIIFIKIKQEFNN